MDKYTKRGFYIFGGCALIIILAGIVLNINEVNASGPVGGGKFIAGSDAILNGSQVIWVGIIMLLLVLIMLLSMLSGKSK